MSVWKPTEGLKRAIPIVDEFVAAYMACGTGVVYHGWPLLRQRMTDVIAKALDQALADGAVQDALNAVVGKDDLVLHDEAFSPNGIAETAGRIAVRLTPQERADVDASVRANGGEPQEIDYIVAARQKLQQHAMGVPPTADRVGLDMPDFPAPAFVEIHEPDGGITIEPPPPVSSETPFEAPAPKKRGRPKGSTNKAKKKARAAKKATAEQSSGVEAQAEPPAGEAA